MNKTNKILILIGILLTIIGVILLVLSGTLGNKPDTQKEAGSEQMLDNRVVESVEKTNEDFLTTGVTIVPTMQDKITADSSWCGTFQLVWNDMKNEVVKQDIVFTPQEEMAVNLNREDFKANMISEEYYFKKYGLKTLELKEQIEKGIKEKFNQTSDILENFDWSEEELNDPNNLGVDRYFFYAMLYRKFEFLKEFSKLDEGNFGNNYEDVEYFGIDKNTDKSVGNQIDILYYNSKEDFAIIINTKTDDEVIFCKSPNGATFKEIYDNMNNKANKYTGDKSFKNIDEFKAPNLIFNEKREYEELQNREFKTDRGIGEILKAIQLIKFSLDEKGGEIKSEAGIDMTLRSAGIINTNPEQPRYFYVDNTFALFLREKEKNLPYFAARIEDITKFQ